MKTKLTQITPELARTWLKENTSNRNVRQNHVNYLASEMSNGRWLVTHQGICIAEDGTLLDGQHRLLAIIQSGRSVEMMVARGGDRATQEVTDIGSCPRNVGDMLHMIDGMSDAALRVSACRQVVVICGHFQNYRMSVGLARIIHSEIKSELDFVIPSLRTFKPAYKGWAVGTLALCLSADKRCAEFISKFGSGEGLKQADAAKAARDWFVNGNGNYYTYKKGAVESLCNGAYNGATNSPITTLRTGSRGLDHFMGKKRGLIEAVRVQISQQIEQKSIKDKARIKAKRQAA